MHFRQEGVVWVLLDLLAQLGSILEMIFVSLCVP